MTGRQGKHEHVGAEISLRLPHGETLTLALAPPHILQLVCSDDHTSYHKALSHLAPLPCPVLSRPILLCSDCPVLSYPILNCPAIQYYLLAEWHGSQLLLIHQLVLPLLLLSSICLK